MNIKIICVGKIKEKFYTDAVNEYLKRLSAYATMSVVELPDEKCDENASDAMNAIVLKKEGDRILSKISDNDFVIALAINGKMYDSVELSDYIKDLTLHGNSTIDFVIGGSLGLSPEVYARANHQISFSKMTFPHQLMRVILLEQIYRSFRIMKNQPYHK